MAGRFGDENLTTLLLYDKGSGQGQRVIIDPEGTFALPGEPFTWAPGWDTIVPGPFGAADSQADLLLYDADTGNAALVQADDTEALSRPGIQQSIPGQWDTVVGGRFGASSSSTDLFLYSVEQGRGAFYTFDDQGAWQEFGNLEDLGPGWDQIIPGFLDIQDAAVVRDAGSCGNVLCRRVHSSPGPTHSVRLVGTFGAKRACFT